MVQGRMKSPNIGKVVDMHRVRSDDENHQYVIRKHSDGTITFTEFQKQSLWVYRGGMKVQRASTPQWIKVATHKAGTPTKQCCCRCNCCN